MVANNKHSLDPAHPWIHGAFADTEGGSGVQCARCGAHQPFAWTLPQDVLDRFVSAFREKHKDCPFNPPRFTDIPTSIVPLVTLREALDAATPYLRLADVKDGAAVEIRMAHLQFGGCIVVATRVDDADPTFHAMMDEPGDSMTDWTSEHLSDCCIEDLWRPI